MTQATQAFGILAMGIIIGALILLAITHADIAWKYFQAKLTAKLSKPRWRIEEVRCDKCSNSDKPGYRRYESFNPVTEEVEVSLLSCDKCMRTPGKLKIVVVADEMDPENWAEVQREISEQIKDYDEIRSESEMREDDE